MSKNFEVLQRVEQERKNSRIPQTPLSVFDQQQTEDAARQCDSIQEITSCDSPAERMSSSQKEEIRRLVNRLFMLTTMGAPRVVAIAGIDDDKGSSAIISGAAEMLAGLTSKRVCLVDASYHAPSVHVQFGITSDPGFMNAAIAEEPVSQCLQRVDERLWIMPAGSNVSQQPRSENMIAVLSELRAQFDFVLLHVAPLAVDEDALITAELWDGVALVLEANVTRRGTAQAVKSMLESANVHVFGAVLNNRRFPIPDALYSRL